MQRVKYIFAKLIGTYGTSFSRQLENQTQAQLMQAEWADGLAEFQDYQVERGLGQLPPGSFAPSLPDFKVLCLTVPAAEMQMYKTNAPRLPHIVDKEANKATAAEAISKMRTVLV
ncbi:MAG: hypothetical protein GY753_09695 [Gammaproteobacteria bacterium]|nr:hypothetical protein [Gammaproteobacteria bacterium]